jgi:hypothetical protein
MRALLPFEEVDAQYLVYTSTDLANAGKAVKENFGSVARLASITCSSGNGSKASN